MSDENEYEYDEYDEYEEYEDEYEEYEDDTHVNKRKSYPKKMKNKVLLIILFIVLAIAAFLLSPFFAVKTINISEMKKYSYEDICSIAGIHEGQNILLLNRLSVAGKLKDDTHVEKVKISKKLPDTVNIKIEERLVRGYVPYMGSYLYIDDNGRVLEVKNEIDNKLPVVTGLKFTGFVLGEKIDADNKEAFDIMVTVAQLIEKYELIDNTVSIDVSDITNIKAGINKVEVNLGDTSNIDTKIRIMAQAVAALKEDDRGTLNLSDISKPIIFKYLT